MRPLCQMLAMTIGGFGLMLFCAAHVFAENIYHWKDQNGISYYSNATIPSGERDFSVIPGGRSATSRIEGPDTGDGMEEVAGQTPAMEGSGEVYGSRKAALKDRIEHRRASIHAIEDLLKMHPNDSGLRKRLFQKKQSLNEDVIRLKLLTK